MALQLSGKVNIYTNGDLSLKEQLQSALAKPTPKIHVDSRKIAKLAMASSEASDVIVTFEDGATAREGFIVRRTP